MTIAIASSNFYYNYYMYAVLELFSLQINIECSYIIIVVNIA